MDDMRAYERLESAVMGTTGSREGAYNAVHRTRHPYLCRVTTFLLYLQSQAHASQMRCLSLVCMHAAPVCGMA